MAPSLFTILSQSMGLLQQAVSYIIQNPQELPAFIAKIKKNLGEQFSDVAKGTTDEQILNTIKEISCKEEERTTLNLNDIVNIVKNKDIYQLEKGMRVAVYKKEIQAQQQQPQNNMWNPMENFFGLVENQQESIKPIKIDIVIINSNNDVIFSEKQPWYCIRCDTLSSDLMRSFNGKDLLVLS